MTESSFSKTKIVMSEVQSSAAFKVEQLDALFGCVLVDLGEVSTVMSPDEELVHVLVDSLRGVSLDDFEGVIFVKKRANWMLRGGVDVHHRPKPQQLRKVSSCGVRRSGCRHS